MKQDFYEKEEKNYRKIAFPIIFHKPPWEPVYLFCGLCYIIFLWW